MAEMDVPTTAHVKSISKWQWRPSTDSALPPLSQWINPRHQQRTHYLPDDNDGSRLAPSGDTPYCPLDECAGVDSGRLR
jgi:hypothetical protein